MHVPIRNRISMASFTRSTTSTSAVVAGDRVAVLVLLAPKLYLVLLGALDASLAHLLVVFDFCFRELAVLSEYDVETEPEDTETYKDYSCQKDFHNASL